MTGAALEVHAVLRRGQFSLDAALTARPGETVAVMGPSGAGKSTLLDVIAGLARVREGHVRVDEREVSARGTHVPPQKRGVVLLRQDPQLFPHLSARDNVAFGLRARGIPRGQAVAAADEWLWRVGLPGSGAHAPRELSGGQQQRVALARALAAGPSVLLLDEPLTALDPETAGGVRSMLSEQLPGARTTAVLVTHDAVDAAALAQHLVLIEQGRVTQSGAVREVLGAPATAFGATVAGMNRIVGRARGGLWQSGPLALATSLAGAVAALFRPADVALEAVPTPTWTGALRLAEAGGSVAGEWIARVDRLEQTLSGVRVHTTEPGVAVDVPVAEVAALGLVSGSPLRLRLDAAAAVRFVPA